MVCPQPKKSAIPILLSLLLLAGPALAHGGDYRGPAGQVPPTGRTPGDPTPPPQPNPGTTPSQPGGPPGVTPNGPRGFGPTPARPGAPVNAPVNLGPTGTTGSTGRRKPASIEGFERWEFWWGYNKDEYLKLKSHLNQGGASTESSTYFLGNADLDNVKDTTAPTRTVIESKIIPALEKALEDPFFDVRAAAVIALGKVGNQAHIPLLLKTLKDDNKQVRESSALALGILGHPDAVHQLSAILHDEIEGKRLLGRTKILTRTRAFAAIGLGLIGANSPEGSEMAFPPLLAALRRNEAQQDVIVASLNALGVMQFGKAVPHLLDIVMNVEQDFKYRAHAVIALGKIGDRSVVPTLHRCLRDKNLQVRRSAILALGVLADATDAETVKRLQAEVDRAREPQIRNWALISLGKIGGNAAKKTLLRTLIDSQKSTKAFAALGLGIMLRDKPDVNAANHVLNTFRDIKGDSVRGGLAIALGMMGHDVAEKDLLELTMSKGDPDLRGYCAIGLGLLDAKKVTTKLTSILGTRIDPDFQRSAAVALGLLGDRNVVENLTRILKTATTEYEISSSAIALGTIGDVSAIDPLIEILEAKQGVADLARANATTALGLVGDRRELPPLHVFSRGSNYRCMVDALNELFTIL